MARKRKALQEGVSADSPASEQLPPKNELNWAQERFVEAYARNGGNATQAYGVAYPRSAPTSRRAASSALLTKFNIIQAIEDKKEEDRRALSFDRQSALRILVGMATASLDDFADIFEDPADQENYCGLGDKRFAIESAKRTVTSVPGKEGEMLEKTELKIISPGERRNAINELWEKLGLGEGAGKGSWFDGFEQLAGLIRKTEKK